jgi:hypothetical protein
MLGVAQVPLRNLEILQAYLLLSILSFAHALKKKEAE